MGDYFGGLLKTIKRKSPVNQRLTGLCCGERGIRTPGTSRYDGFQDRCNRPLYHLSKPSQRLVKHLCFVSGRLFYQHPFPKTLQRYALFLD